MIRVLQVVHSMNKGGIETFVMNVYRSIDIREIQFDFLILSEGVGFYEDEIRKRGGEIFHLPGRRAGILTYKKKLLQFFEKHHLYQAVHMHVSSLSDIEPLKAASRYQIPNRIIHGHSTKEGGFFALHKCLHRVHGHEIEKYATRLLACSDTVAQWMYPKTEHPVLLLKNGIDIGKFVFDRHKREEIREKLQCGQEHLIGHIGRMVPVKNHHRVIDIFEKVSQTGEAKLVLLGDGPLKMEIEAYVRDKGLTDKVIFPGMVDNVNEYLQALDILLLPSLYEGFPVTLIEAQTSGLPCLVSDAVTKSAQIIPDVCFFSLGESDEAWSDKLQSMLGQKPDRTNAWVSVKNARYDIRDSVDELCRLYME